MITEPNLFNSTTLPSQPHHENSLTPLNVYDVCMNDLTEEDVLSIISVDLECYMEFPQCPTTIPKLDPHYQSAHKNYSLTDWPAMRQEYDQYCTMNTEDSYNRNSKSHLELPALQDDISIFSDVSSLSSCSTTYHDPTGSIDGEYPHFSMDSCFNEPLHRHPSITIEDLIMQPPPVKPFITSPGQIFKSKFQKAVNKMKKTNLITSSLPPVSKDDSSKINFNVFSKKHASDLVSTDCATISSHPSFSTRLHNQFKGKLNKLFKK